MTVCLKKRRNPLLRIPPQRVDGVPCGKKLRHAEETSKKVGIFDEHKFVSVHWYGRACVRRKQAMARFPQWDPRHYSEILSFIFSKIFVFFLLLAVDLPFSTV